MQYNVNNPSVKRILREVKEMEAEPSDQYTATPLEDNIFEWHFTIRGPHDTEFEGGLYHGRIILPPEYPFKPPNIVLLNPNGRFEVGTKICLSISSYHPEHWQPSWSIRTVLVALISFMPTKADGAIGAIDYSPEERRKLAKKSLSFVCDKCGTHLSKVFPDKPATAPNNTPNDSSNNNSNTNNNNNNSNHVVTSPTVNEAPIADKPTSALPNVNRVTIVPPTIEPVPSPTPPVYEPRNVNNAEVQPRAEPAIQPAVPIVPQNIQPVVNNNNFYTPHVQQAQVTTQTANNAPLDYIIIALVVAILALVFRKLYS
jgi:ubiquitin-conjugating enzyme E2 J1